MIATWRINLVKASKKIKLWFDFNLFLLACVFSANLVLATKPRWWEDAYSLTINLLAGSLVSFFFYWLVVYIPEQRRRNIIKANLTSMYRQIKEDIIWQIVFASIKGGRKDLQPNQETVEALMSIEGFRTAFRGGREADEGFYAFENQMSHNTPEFRNIVLLLEMLAKQVEFVLHNYSIDDDKVFNFFKGLELMLLSLENSSPGYEESKQLCGFLYRTFAAFDFASGDMDHELIEKMISEI